jgi:hypothetical protein
VRVGAPVEIAGQARNDDEGLRMRVWVRDEVPTRNDEEGQSVILRGTERSGVEAQNLLVPFTFLPWLFPRPLRERAG